VPGNFESIRFSNSSFKDIPKNQSGLMILKKGFKQKQFILSNENEHTVELMAQYGEFVPLKSIGASNVGKKSNILLGLALFGVFVLIMFIRSKTQELETQVV